MKQFQGSFNCEESEEMFKVFMKNVVNREAP